MFGAFTSFGKLGSLARAIAAAWTPSALWPTGTEPGMWIDPSLLTASFNDYLGTTPVAAPGTVADSANPVGLALDLRLGAPTTLGPELVVNGDFATDLSGWTVHGDYVVTRDTSVFPAGAMKVVAPTSGINGRVEQFVPIDSTKQYSVSATFYSPSSNPSTYQQGCLSLYAANDTALWPGVEDTIKTVQWHVPGGSGTLSLRPLVFAPYREWGPAGSEFYITNISVKEIPGNHLLQATSTARPLLSRRVNLLTYTEDFSNAAWYRGGVSVSSNTTTAPDGTNTADTIIASASFGEHRNYQFVSGQRGDGVFSVYLKAKEYGFAFVAIAESNATLYKGALVNLSNGAVVSNSANAVNVVDAGSGWYRISVQETAIDIDYFGLVAPAPSADVTINAYGPLFTGDGTSGIYAWGAHLERGAGPTPNTYQPILTDGSSYPSTGFHVYQKYDGTDDGMATASFAAGTLTSSMDCLIAVRRDATGNSVVGFYQGLGVAFGQISGAAAVSTEGAGSPTVWVDGVQLAGGTAVTQSTLNDAVTVGDWHIVEWRDLNLSAWTALKYGAFGFGYTTNGANGGALIFPGGNTAGRDQARAWLAAKVGVTLP